MDRWTQSDLELDALQAAVRVVDRYDNQQAHAGRDGDHRRQLATAMAVDELRKALVLAGHMPNRIEPPAERRLDGGRRADGSKCNAAYPPP